MYQQEGGTNTQSNTKYGGTSCQNFNRHAYQIRFMLLLLMSKYPPSPHPGTNQQEVFSYLLLYS